MHRSMYCLLFAMRMANGTWQHVITQPHAVLISKRDRQGTLSPGEPSAGSSSSVAAGAGASSAALALPLAAAAFFLPAVSPVAFAGFGAALALPLAFPFAGAAYTPHCSGTLLCMLDTGYKAMICVEKAQHSARHAVLCRRCHQECPAFVGMQVPNTQLSSITLCMPMRIATQTWTANVYVHS